MLGILYIIYFKHFVTYDRFNVLINLRLFSFLILLPAFSKQA